MEIVFNGNKFVVSVDGQRAAAVYCMNYAEGRYDVVFNDDVVDQNPLPIFEQLLVNATDRVPVLESNEANTWRYVVPNPVMDLDAIQIHNDGDKIRFFDNTRELFYAVLVGEETYNIIETSTSDLCAHPRFNEVLVAKFESLFSGTRHVKKVGSTIWLSFNGSVDDHPLDMFHVQTTGHGVFQITSAAGRVGEMREYSLYGDIASNIRVQFTSYNGTPFPETFRRELYKRTTGYGISVGTDLDTVDVHEYMSLLDIETLQGVLVGGIGEDNALISIREILPSVILTVNNKHYAVMPVFVDPRDSRENCSGDVVYRGKPIGKGLVLPIGYLCMEATDAICNILAPIATKGPSAIPVSAVLEAFMIASDDRDGLRISMFDPGTERRGHSRRDTDTRGRGRSRGR